MKIAIVGLGNIAWKFDFYKHSKTTQSHYSSYKSLGYNDIIGIDPCPESRKNFELSTSCITYSNLDECFKHHKEINIASICSPNHAHVESLIKLIDHGVKFIWLEKPAFILKHESLLIQEKLKKNNNCRIIVSYFRRFSEPYQALQQCIISKEFGEVKKININYSRGFETNAVHLIDLIKYYFKEGHVSMVSNIIIDNNPNMTLRINDIGIFISGASLSFHDLEFTVTFERGKVAILKGGKTMSIEKMVENEAFPGFFHLKTERIIEYSQIGNEQILILKNLLNTEEENISPIFDSFFICDILEYSRENSIC